MGIETDTDVSLQILENVYNNRNVVGNVGSADVFEFCFSACQQIANLWKVDLKKPPVEANRKMDVAAFLNKIAEANHFRLRIIKLNEGWENQDMGPFVGLYQGNVIAAIRANNDAYTLINTAENYDCRVTAKIAAEIDTSAFVFYPSLPDVKTTLVTIWNFTTDGFKLEFLKILGLQVIMSGLFLVAPAATGYIFDNVIPNANVSVLLQFMILFIINIFVIVLTNISQAIAVLRLRIKADNKLQAAIWDRLLKLPLKFFKNFTAGDLAYRASGIAEIQRMISTNAVLTIIRGVISIISLILMFFLNVYLGLAAALLVLVIVLTSFCMNMLILKQEQSVIHQRSKINGLLFEIVNSIVKLRVAHREKEGFQLWLKEFAQITKSELHAGKYKMGLTAFNLGFAEFCTFVIYTLVIMQGHTISFGAFIVFNAVFMQFLASIMLMIKSISASLQAIPLFYRAKPIFDALPEDHGERAESSEIDGHISLENIVFRYDKDAKPIFKDFSLDIPRGLFTAIVGPSGSGKSTIFRLLLGLEEPESGGIFYSGMNLKTLKLQSLRQQLGVVMQSTQLLPGTIYENIAGQCYGLTRDEAWNIAEKVGIAGMIHNLPMGMDTLINDGIQTLSGGEIQRLNLARAMAHKPKILLLDEATSALDNRVQQQVQHYLQEIKVTQVVIAHRFSTIVHADIIHVIDQGQCVETGNYQQLMAQRGVFYHLARRQIVENDCLNHSSVIIE